jgi:hypothetical protein
LITVVQNRSKSNGVPRFNVGRPTALGNPYPVETHGRERAVELYRELLESSLAHPIGPKSKAMLERFEEIVHEARTGDIEIGCSCAPLPCHGDVIKELVEKRLANG